MSGSRTAQPVHHDPVAWPERSRSRGSGPPPPTSHPIYQGSKISEPDREHKPKPSSTGNGDPRPPAQFAIAQDRKHQVSQTTYQPSLPKSNPQTMQPDGITYRESGSRSHGSTIVPTPSTAPRSLIDGSEYFNYQHDKQDHAEQIRQERGKLEKERVEWQRKCALWERECAEWQRKRRGYEQDYDRRYHVELERKELSIRDLESELTQSTQLNTELLSQISEMRPKNPNTVTDSQITKDYRLLISRLENMTFSSFSNAIPDRLKDLLPDFGFRPSETDPIHVKIAEGLARCLGESSNRRFLGIGMLVMGYLNEKVFRRFLFGLTGEQDEFFKKLAMSSENSWKPKDINFWRAETLGMVTSTEAHQLRVQEQKEELVAQLESILCMAVPPDEDATRRIKRLQVVVNQAVSLALTLSVQRASYLLEWPLPGDKFKPFIDPAEDNGEDGGSRSEHGKGSTSHSKKQEKIVELTVYPALVKRGNDDGEKYDEPIYICNAKALFKPIPEKASDKSSDKPGFFRKAIGIY